MKIKLLGLIILLLAWPVRAVWSQGSDIVKRGQVIQNLEWEFTLGGSLCNNWITSLPEDQPSSNFQSNNSTGFQFAASPLFRINRSLAVRPGLMFLKREYEYKQILPWEAEYAEKSYLIGIPAHVLYTFGYSDLKFNVFTGLQINYRIKSSLDYSALAIPGFRQEGSINNYFDRKRLLGEFQLGAGIRFQVSKIYIGADFCFFLNLWDHSRFSPPRSIHIYQDLEPSLAYYSPGYTGHGIMLNLVFRKRKG